MGATSKSTERMSPLAKDQQKILNESWDMYLKDTYPEALKMLKYDAPSMVDEIMPNAMKSVNEAYDAGKTTIGKSLAQRGLLGETSGVESATVAGLEAGRSNSLSQAYNNVLMQDKQNQVNLTQQTRMNALSMLMGKAPQPTQAAPTLTTKTESGGVLGTIGGVMGAAAGLPAAAAGGLFGVGAGAGLMKEGWGMGKELFGGLF